MTTLRMELGEKSYGITVGKALLARAEEYFNLKRKVLIVTDSGVPVEYSKAIAACAKEPTVISVPSGEGSKDIKTVELLCKKMLDLGFSRSDCVVAVGGGVVGDLAGFAASVYMRGIDFYNVPTTLLSQVDSSIGGKTAVNLSGVKNVVGSFYQPSGVFFDPKTLDTLSPEIYSDGMAEVIKYGAIIDEKLFSELEKCDGRIGVEQIKRCIEIKRDIVENDEFEGGIRKLLNFSSTINNFNFSFGNHKNIPHK